MINKEQFKTLLEDHIKWDERISEVSDILGTQIWEADWVMYTGELFDKFLTYSFEDSAVDTINWWLWEAREYEDISMWDKDKNPIPTKTVDDIWEIVKDYRK